MYGTEGGGGLKGLTAGMEKIADHGTNGPRNFSRSLERINRIKEK